MTVQGDAGTQRGTRRRGRGRGGEARRWKGVRQGRMPQGEAQAAPTPPAASCLHPPHISNASTFPPYPTLPKALPPALSPPIPHPPALANCSLCRPWSTTAPSPPAPQPSPPAPPPPPPPPPPPHLYTLSRHASSTPMSVRCCGGTSDRVTRRQKRSEEAPRSRNAWCGTWERGEEGRGGREGEEGGEEGKLCVMERGSTLRAEKKARRGESRRRVALVNVGAWVRMRGQGEGRAG